jgi:D-3-phosphoglycerate dehydrogenase
MTSKFKAVITDLDFPTFKYGEEKLKKNGVDLQIFQCKTENEILNIANNADALLVQYAKITKEIIRKMNNTKIIVRLGIGIDNIDIKAATEKGIFVANTPYDISNVADHTVALILSLIRKIPMAWDSTRKGEWNWKGFVPTIKMKEATIGIIGLGNIGRKVAIRLKSFGAQIIAYDPYISLDAFSELGVKYFDLEQLLRKSDIITLHVPLTKETFHLINEGRLKRMKKNSYIINVSRGGIIDETALYKALKNGWIAGAATDVLEEEPPSPDNPLLKLPNFIATPHMAWSSEATLKEVQIMAANEVLRVFRGGFPKNLVNKEVLKLKRDSTRNRRA